MTTTTNTTYGPNRLTMTVTLASGKTTRLYEVSPGHFTRRPRTSK